MNCKNCGHELVVEGQSKDDRLVQHEKNCGGVSEICDCGCKKPETKTTPIYCKNCGHEILKRLFKSADYQGRKTENGWWHVNLNSPGLHSRAGYLRRELALVCNTHRYRKSSKNFSGPHPCHCENPEPEETKP